MIDFERKEHYGLSDLLRIVALLRSEGGCPWDRVQTHASLRRSLLEEAYEAAEAIDREDPALLKEELGGSAAAGGIPCRHRAAGRRFHHRRCGRR